MANFGQFANDLQGCGSIVTAGACIAVGALPDCATEAPVYTLTVDTGGGALVGETSITVTAALAVVGVGLATIELGAGKYLYFSGGGIAKIVTGGKVDTDGVDTLTLTVEPIETTAIADAETADTWALLDLVAPTDIPLTSNDTLVDTTDTKGGLQGSEQKTNIMLDTTVQAILKPNDPALCFFHDASQQDVEATVVIALNGDIYAIGRAIICNIQYPNPVKEVIRPQFQVKFQPPYSFVNFGCKDPAVAADLADIQLLNTQLELAGFAAIPEV